MSARVYRLSIVMLFATFIACAFIIADRFMERLAENGRYVQFDLRKASTPDGTVIHRYESWVIDSRTGRIIIQGHPNRSAQGRP